jgi:TetR/AcrR family transcriptional regulator, transcriptional repressor for nem operon
MPRTSDAKERLLNVTIDKIWRNGVASVSVDDLCDAADVRKGSFYHYFKSKSELVVAAIDWHWAHTMRPWLDRVFSPSLSPVERFRTYFRETYARQVELKQKFGQVLGCPLCSIGSEACLNDEAIVGKVREIMSSYDRYWMTSIRDMLLDRGEPLDRADELADTLEAFMQGVVTQARIKNDPDVVRQLEPGGLRILGVDTHKAVA